MIQTSDARATPLDALSGKNPWSSSWAEFLSVQSPSISYMSTFSCHSPHGAARSNTTASVCTCPPLLASCIDFPLLRAFWPRATPCQGGRRRGALEEYANAFKYINPLDSSSMSHARSPTGNTIVQGATLSILQSNRKSQFSPSKHHDV